MYKKAGIALIASIFVWVQVAQTAGPLTHAFLGNYWLHACGALLRPEDQDEFIVGTMYPDIRYPADLKREVTHASDVSLAHVGARASADSIFEAGKKFHAWVDDVREHFMTPAYTASLSKQLPAMAAKSTFLKFLEDELLFRLVQAWRPALLLKFQKMLFKYYPAERIDGVSQDILKEWHALLIEHFTYSPLEIFKRLSQEHQAYGVISPEQVVLWAKLLDEYADNPVFVKHVKELVAYFVKFMQHCDSQDSYSAEFAEKFAQTKRAAATATDA